MKQSLEKIRDDIPTSKKQANQEILTQIGKFSDLIDILTKSQQYTLKHLQQFYEDDK
ncbi:MAG: hypothetical protein ACW98F_10900 [Candidatus Hodarchaeales archaeon]